MHSVDKEATFHFNAKDVMWEFRTLCSCLGEAEETQFVTTSVIITNS
jgi:hypothetical protein